MVEIVTPAPQQGPSVSDQFRDIGAGLFGDGLTPYQRQMMALSKAKSSRVEGAHVAAADALRRGDTREYLAQSILADRSGADAGPYLRIQAANDYGADDPRTTTAMVGAGDPYGIREAQANKRTVAGMWRRAYTPATPGDATGVQTPGAPAGDPVF
jgi:hypothetical protein